MSVTYHSHFSHIYVEKQARDYALTKKVLGCFPKAQVIEIESYRDVFLRPRQSFQTQKKSQKLILACKQEPFLYPTTAPVQDLGWEHSYYLTLMLNCLYNCEYCFLQGMYPSANLVCFVNEADFFKATEDQLKILGNEPLYLSLSYETDLLAFESVACFCQSWIEFVQNHPNLHVEIRTKSSQADLFSRLAPSEQVLWAWTLSPDEMRDRHEPATPSFNRRLKAMATAQKQGWPVRLCLDPLIDFPSWQEAYHHMIHEIFAELDPVGLYDVTVGVYRMSPTLHKKMQAQRRDSALIHQPWQKRGGLMTYEPQTAQNLSCYVGDLLKTYLPEEKIKIWT